MTAPEPLKIVGVEHVANPTSTKFLISCHPSDGRMEVSGRYEEFQFDLTLPESKVIQPDDTTVIFCGQRADRQWKRGFGYGTFGFWNPADVLYNELLEVQGTLTIPREAERALDRERKRFRGRDDGDSLHNIVYHVFRPTYRTFNDCVHFLRNRSGLFAVFSEHFFLSLAPDDPNYLLWRDTLPIGRVHRNTLDITCFDGIFTQEVRDYFARQGQNHGVIQ